MDKAINIQAFTSGVNDKALMKFCFVLEWFSLDCRKGLVLVLVLVLLRPLVG